MANSLLLATVIRIGFVIISYGCKVPAGIFVPSMAVGATFGRMIGIMVKAMYRCVIENSSRKACSNSQWQGVSSVRHVCGLSTRCALHYTGYLCISRCSGCSCVSSSTKYESIGWILSSGVMRITVTVVVIMFELTGALTYILPTMVSHNPIDWCPGPSKTNRPVDRSSSHQGCRRFLWNKWHCRWDDPI